MKFFIDNWMLLAVAISSGSLLLWPVLKGATASGLSATMAVQLINREKAVLLDVSEPEEFSAAHAGGAKNLPLGQLEAKLAQLVKHKDTPVIMICPRGQRAGRAAALAQKMGYAQAQVLAGGMIAWKEANLPVEKAA